MTIFDRLKIYGASIVLATVLITWWAIEDSRANLVHDKSSMAWVQFLPFIIPIFAGYAAAGVAAIAAVAEIALAVWRRSK